MKVSLFSKVNLGRGSILSKAKRWLSYTLAMAVFSTFSVSSHAIEAGVQAPDFELSTFSGETFKLSDYRGKKPVYLVFWATWCPICRAEIPHIKKIHSQLGDDVEMLAINVGFNDSLSKAQAYQTEHQLTYPVAFDENSVLTKRYAVVGTPWQVVIDINGVVRYSHHATPIDIADHLDSLREITQ